MPKAYGYDLWTKVIESIEIDGLKICQAAKLLHINHNTIALWLKRKRLTGDFIKLYQIDHQALIIELPIGKSLLTSLRLMEIKPKKKWLNYGKDK